MTKRLDTAAAALALAAMLAGCAHNSMRGESGDGAPGAALRATLAAQVANPDAGRNPNPAAGLDGQAARAAVEHYERAQGTHGDGAAPGAGMIK